MRDFGRLSPRQHPTGNDAAARARPASMQDTQVEHQPTGKHTEYQADSEPEPPGILSPNRLALVVSHVLRIRDRQQPNRLSLINQQWKPVSCQTEDTGIVDGFAPQSRILNCDMRRNTPPTPAPMVSDTHLGPVTETTPAPAQWASRACRKRQARVVAAGQNGSKFCSEGGIEGLVNSTSEGDALWKHPEFCVNRFASTNLPR